MVKQLKNTTNWQLYNSSDSEKKQKKTSELEIENKDLLKKLKLVEKAFK